MSSFVLVIAVTSFLCGGATAVFTMLVIGIRKADRIQHLPAARNTPLDTVTRTVLGANTWPGSPVVHGDRQDG